MLLLAIAVRAVYPAAVIHISASPCIKTSAEAASPARDVPVNHDTGRDARLLEALGGLLDVFGFVVRAAVGAAQDDVASRVAFSLHNCEQNGISPPVLGAEYLAERLKAEGGTKMDAVDVLAEMPCLVTDKKACELEADPIASMAIWSEPSVPFLNPMGIDIPEASSRCTCDSVAASAFRDHCKGSVA